MLLWPEIETIDSHCFLAHKEALLNKIDAVSHHALQYDVLSCTLIHLESNVLSANFLDPKLRELAEYEKVFLQEVSSLNDPLSRVALKGDN